MILFSRTVDGADLLSRQRDLYKNISPVHRVASEENYLVVLRTARSSLLCSIGAGHPIA
jgi:hypothetical protein